MQSDPDVGHKDRRVRIYLESLSKMVLRKLKSFLVEIDDPETIPGIIMSFIYTKRTLKTFYSKFIFFQC